MLKTIFIVIAFSFIASGTIILTTPLVISFALWISLLNPIKVATILIISGIVLLLFAYLTNRMRSS